MDSPGQQSRETADGAEDDSPSQSFIPRVPGGRFLQEIGEPLELFRALCRTAVRHPKGLAGDVRDDAFSVLRKTFVPGAFALLGYGVLTFTFSLAILLFLGAANRLGTVYLSFVMREIAPFITGTTIAGVIGTATTSEIGARKIRGELNALRVLGQDPIRVLILPRVISISLLTCGLNVFGVFLVVAEGALGINWLGDGTSTAAFVDSFLTNLTLPEIYGNVLKTFLTGLFIGLVCSSKGLNSPSGSEGLGKSVNRAVVVSVMAVYIIDVVFNMILQGLSPDFTISR